MPPTPPARQPTLATLRRSYLLFIRASTTTLGRIDLTGGRNEASDA